MNYILCSIGELHVQAELQKDDAIDFPTKQTTTAFDLLLKRMTKTNSTSCCELERNAIDFCGVTVVVIAKIWELMMKHCDVPVDKLKQKHLLWTLHHMKQYSTTNTMAATVKLESKTTQPAQKTLLKWIPIVLDAIYELVPHVIKW